MASLPTDRAGRPSVLGYVVAVAVSLLVFAIELGLLNGDHLGMFEAVLLLGALPAVILGGIGAVVVDLATFRADAQRWHVAGAAVVGLAVGLLVNRLTLDELSSGVFLGLTLAVATGLGRWAAVTFVPRRVRPTSPAQG